MFRASPIATLLAVVIASAPNADADVVLEWNEIMLTTLIGQSPGNETRLAAITQLAVFEAVNAITREYEPYLGSVHARPGASAEAAAVTAAHAVLRHYVPESKAALDAAQASSLESILDGPAKKAGIVIGKKAAKAMIDLRADDGAEPPEFHQPGSTDPGEWQLTPNCPEEGGVFLHLRNVLPFGIKSSSQFRAAPPPSLRSWKYAKDYNELAKVGGQGSAERPQDRADVAQFYSVVLALRTWNPAATQVALAQGRSLSENARALALLNMALSDALVAVFETKYHTPFWRPETAIHAGDADGNRKTRGDADFVPFIGTPCHPSYPSAHGSAAYAAGIGRPRSPIRPNRFNHVTQACFPSGAPMRMVPNMMPSNTSMLGVLRTNPGPQIAPGNTVTRLTFNSRASSQARFSASVLARIYGSHRSSVQSSSVTGGASAPVSGSVTMEEVRTTLRTPASAAA
jgi:hypothetical protein